ncbi:MAG TPA: FeoA family protein [Spirochaetota bacterium]|nr:FeoA family protein [Spirochaetota bacterium]HPJ33401.1 FeoA family protein [Spirochaetota bacterium]
MPEKIKISMLEPGDAGIVTGYEKKPGPYRERVLSMGLTKGTEFRLTKKAPMGDPVEIEVLGYKLSLRKEEAEIIKIEKILKEAD